MGWVGGFRYRLIVGRNVQGKVRFSFGHIIRHPYGVCQAGRKKGMGMG